MGRVISALGPLLGALWVLSIPATTQADPVFGRVFEVQQPDGTRVSVRVWGDEFFRILETLDGYTVLRDPETNYLCYATVSGDAAALASTGAAVGQRDPAQLGLVRHLRESPALTKAKVREARARFGRKSSAKVSASSKRGIGGQPTMLGEVAGVCLLVDFADEVGTIPPAEVDRFFNEPGYNGYGNNGSVRDYFWDVSDGRLTYTNYVTPTYYRAARSKNYYIDPDVPQGIRARELVREALIALEDSGFDFSAYDSDGDLFVDAVSCLYAGPRRSAWSSGLWPHTWTINFGADDVYTHKYSIVDMATEEGDSLWLSTICHENGHLLGDWPDLYDVEFDSMGTGMYCIMAGSQSYTSPLNPQEPCAYLKDLAGWSTTVLLTEPSPNLPLPAASNLLYKYAHPTIANEYYLIENRNASGRDVGLPDSGLALWHVDRLGDNSDEDMTPESHYEVALVQADGNWDLENNRNRGDDTDLFGSPDYPVVAPHTLPDTSWWDGTPSGLHIRDISTPGTDMSFGYTIGADCNGNLVPDSQDIAAGTSQDCQPDGIPDECQLDDNDCNNNNVPDFCDLPGNDCNANERPDVCDIASGSSPDCNDNDLPDECDVQSGASEDCNNNDIPDECDVSDGTSADCQPDGVPDECQLASGDCDGNNVPDSCELLGHDCNNNGSLDSCDIAGGGSLDCNLNTRPDECDLASASSADCNGNLTPDECDISAGTSADCQPDAIPDECQLAGNDCDGNSVLDVCELTGSDCNGNAVLDVCDIETGASADCNANTRPDECDLASGASSDCNNNATPDECDIAAAASVDCQPDGVPDECQLVGSDCNANSVPDVCELAQSDCNGNGVLDVCDVAGGTSNDCQPDGVPDECQLSGDDCDTNEVPDTCELVGRDCNGNGVLDSCDIADGGHPDCNGNGAPDECDIGAGTSGDCNNNAVPDECDIAGGTSQDCHADGVPDECQLAGNDCDANGIPDDCELSGRDCNGNGVLDSCDIAGGGSGDCNGNGAPDECDLGSGASADCNVNLRPDECDIAVGSSADCQPDGVPDECQLLGGDCNGNSVPDGCELIGNDCNGNGSLDVCDLAGGSSVDCNFNVVPDECDVSSGASGDCNSNRIPDECDVGAGVSADCQPDGVPDECQLAGDDCDGDGVPDSCELAGRDCNGNAVLDSCDIVSGTSADCNVNDAPDECDVSSGASVDCNSNGVPDECDVEGGGSSDCQVDGVPDECQLVNNDCDGNAVPDDCEIEAQDCNVNGVLDVCDIGVGTSADCQPDGIPDECQLGEEDCDASGVPDACELESRDCNENGVLDVCDIASGVSLDCNVNGVPDACDVGSGISADCNSNAIPDECDVGEGASVDCQPDGVPDECQLKGDDCDGSGVPDVCELSGQDCNSNGALDVCDIGGGGSLDCNSNGSPDECDVSGGTSADCNNNGVPDECDIGGETSVDCQPDGVPDECQVGGNDCDGSGIPDACELPNRDCNDNGILDSCDLAEETSPDCNVNHRPDECDVAVGDSEDCNANGVPDECDIERGASQDCQGDEVPDECQLANDDCDGNGVPDLCELGSGDCNNNGVLDTCDIAGGTSVDCNVNGEPDECDMASGISADCNGNGAPDECDVVDGTSLDCQPDGIPDVCQLVGDDCNVNGVPDGCELAGQDCNGNGALDVCDVVGGASPDGNGNFVPDECERAPCHMAESKKLTASDAGLYDLFGFSACASGVTAVIGAYGDNVQGQLSGAAYVYRLQGEEWVEEAKLVSSGGSAREYFGYSVDVFGDTAVIGAFGGRTQTDSGVAYVFEYDGAGWSEQEKLVPSVVQSMQAFGISVSIDGEVIVVGAYQEDAPGLDSGAGYVFRRDGSEWYEEQRLVASDGATYDNFGYVRVLGDVAVVGAPGDSDQGPGTGSVYVFYFDGVEWVEGQKLVASDGAADDRFGRSLALVDGALLVGAPGDDDTGNESGSVYRFGFDGVAWREVQKFTAWDGAPGDGFGYSVSMAGGTAAVGARYDDHNGVDSGSVYVFDVGGYAPFPQAKLVAFDGAPNDWFGRAVAISETGVVVAGAYQNSQFGLRAGAAYAFVGLNDDCNTNRAVDYCDIVDGVSEDTDGSGVPDECEDVDPGDFNGDGLVDVRDYGAFADCAVGPGVTLVPGEGSGAQCLNAFDFDADRDNDLFDFSILQAMIR